MGEDEVDMGDLAVLIADIEVSQNVGVLCSKTSFLVRGRTVCAYVQAQCYNSLAVRKQQPYCARLSLGGINCLIIPVCIGDVARGQCLLSRSSWETASRQKAGLRSGT